MTTRTEQARRTREAILVTAGRLLQRQGYDATSLQQIADELSITKANVYYYFRTKESLLTALVEPLIDEMTQVVARVETIEDPDRRREELITGFVDLAAGGFERLGHLGLGDPAMRRSLPITEALDDLERRARTALFGPEPTLEQLVAHAMSLDLGPALVRLPVGVPGQRVREVLADHIRRCLPAE